MPDLRRALLFFIFSTSYTSSTSPILYLIYRIFIESSFPDPDARGQCLIVIIWYSLDTHLIPFCNPMLQKGIRKVSEKYKLKTRE